MGTIQSLPELLALLGDDEILAWTGFGEAGNQPVDGQIGVMVTAVNRAVEKKTTPGRECLRLKQYSCWNADTSINHLRLIGAVQAYVNAGRRALDRPVLRQLLYLARGLTGSQLLDPTGGATHYMTKVLFSREPPKWAIGKVPVVTLGGHVFFRDIPW